VSQRLERPLDRIPTPDRRRAVHDRQTAHSIIACLDDPEAKVELDSDRKRVETASEVGDGGRHPYLPLGGVRMAVK
jgi:hypothetical protein